MLTIPDLGAKLATATFGDIMSRPPSTAETSATPNRKNRQEEVAVQVPAAFEYERATSVADAIGLLARFGEDARVIAGGHSLLPMMKLRLARPEFLIDINDLGELDYIRSKPGELAIGPMTRHRTLLESNVVGQYFPIFHDAERVIADPLVRNRGTIGGSLCQADPAEDLGAVCAALGATCVIEGRDGKREVFIEDFHRGPYETDIGVGEMLVEIRIPIAANSGSAYQKVERKSGDWAVVAIGAQVSLEDGNIAEVGLGLAAVGSVGVYAHAARDAVRGHEPSDELFAEAGRLAAAGCEPATDGRGSAEYKRHLVGELTVRALRIATARAQASNGNGKGV
jgi:aerobic carbon-monoxide dehydrogenase medium subunit